MPLFFWLLRWNSSIDKPKKTQSYLKIIDGKKIVYNWIQFDSNTDLPKSKHFFSSGKCKIIFFKLHFHEKDECVIRYFIIIIRCRRSCCFLSVHRRPVSKNIQIFSEEENFSLLGLFYIYLTSLHFVSMFIWRNMIRFYQEMRLEQKYCNRCEINFHIFPETNPFVHSMFFLIGSSQILQKQFVFLMMMMMMTIIIVSVLWDPKINFRIRYFYCFSWF